MVALSNLFIVNDEFGEIEKVFTLIKSLEAKELVHLSYVDDFHPFQCSCTRNIWKEGGLNLFDS